MSTDFFKWKDEYSVGFEVIDNQHKRIIKMLNDLNNAFMNREHEAKILDIISEMAEYTVEHFKTEEDIFKELNYSERITHMKEHSDFIKQVGEFKSKYKKNKSVLTFEIINFLRKWLNAHILVSDKKYVNEFNMANVSL